MRIGFIGLGDMGRPMVRRLLHAGHRPLVWNRSPQPLAALERDGALAASSPAQVMADCDLVGLCLTSHEAVEAVAFGPGGLFSAATIKARAIADFSTGSADAARDLAQRAARHHVDWVDAPVSGGVPAAEQGALIVFAGGTKTGVAALAPLFEAVAQRVTHMGEAGSGQVAKICNQMIVCANIVAIAETTAFARKAGVVVAALAPALAGGFADSTPLQIFGPRMAAHSHEPRLGALRLMRKDAGLAATLADRLGAQTPLLDAARAIYERIDAHPELTFESDLSALIRLYEPRP